MSPALDTSAEPAPTSGFSYVPPTVVTQPTPPAAAIATIAAPSAQAPAPVESSGEPVGTLPAAIQLSSAPAPDTARAAALLADMNAARVEAGLAALTSDDLLVEVALVRARDLVARHYFDHYGPDGGSAFSELGLRGVRYGLAGENLARNNYPGPRSATVAFDGLMASPGHRANILEPRFRAAGVVAIADGAMWYYVTVFVD
ncbi:MAG: hypothetical protein HY875_04545 [Chloroflexi bacterium]|nr:hypothetical protein [Chloroflexota bacterium]